MDDVHVVFVPELGTILAVLADPAGLEAAVRGHFDTEEAEARDNPDEGACWFVWHSFAVDDDGWEVEAVCGRHPEETEPGAWQYGTLVRWSVT